MEEEQPPAGRWRTLARRVGSLSHQSSSPRVRRWVLTGSLTLFLAITALSVRSLPNGVHFHWWALGILVVVMPSLGVAANAAEFRVMGAVNGHRIGWTPAVQLTIAAGAANFLPLPGGILIRTQALRVRGSSYRHAVAANAAAGLTWVGVGCLAIAGFFATSGDTRLAAAGLAVAGIAALASVVAMLRRIDPVTALRFLLQLMLVEAATVAIGGVRIFVAFHFIGLHATPAQAVALTASQIIAAAVGIFPGGLGIREVLAGGIASALNLAPAKAVAAIASDRVAGQIGLAALALVLVGHARLTRDRGTAAEPAPEPPGEPGPGVMAEVSGRNGGGGR